MGWKRIVIAALFFNTFPVFAGGLSAHISDCPSEVVATGIGKDIGTAVVKTLVGGLIDTVTSTLGENNIETFDIVLPVDNVSDLFSSGGTLKCVVVSSSKVENSDSKAKPSPAFSATFKFVQGSKDTTKTVARPIVVAWEYNKFLFERCPWYLRCGKRDVAFTLEMFEPTTKAPDGIGNSQPLGVIIENTDAAGVKAALKKGDNLPWFVANPKSGPVNLRFRMVETMKPYAFSKALADALKAEKENILTSVENKLKGISDQVEAQAAQKDVTEANTAFDNYKNAWNAANTTREAHAKASASDKKQLELTYALQRKSVTLTETLAKAAFEIADLSPYWPVGGLGTLPDSL